MMTAVGAVFDLAPQSPVLQFWQHSGPVGRDLKKIKDAQPQLDSQRKQQVQSANQEFSAVLPSVASNVGQNLSLSNAGAQLKSAVQRLAQSYQTALAPISCT